MWTIPGCFYFLVGSLDQRLPSGQLIQGWVARQQGWGHRDSAPSVTLFTRYVTSLAFALAPVDHSETDAEKLMGIVLGSRFCTKNMISEGTRRASRPYSVAHTS